MKEWPFLIGAIVLETFATTMLKELTGTVPVSFFNSSNRF